MSTPTFLQNPNLKPIHTIDTHTCGEPTRVICNGFPKLSGTLLEQRAQARQDYDHVRSRLMLEPRGHNEMYGALLCPDTELTNSGAAHIGVLFMYNDGFSTIQELKHDHLTNITILNLHAPCGLLQVTCTTTADGSRSDPFRPVTFVSVSSFATAIQVSIPIAESYRWPELGKKDTILADFSYGGTFYCMVSYTELGFKSGLQKFDFEALKTAARSLKACADANQTLQGYFHHPDHPDHPDLSYLYGVIVVDGELGVIAEGTSGAETGVCYFGLDQQIDRSPTGGGVAARVALSYAKGHLAVGESWTYHSLLSNSFKGRGSFTGTVYEELENTEIQGTSY